MWWYILGLNPTDDEKTVKRTYAKMIKGVDQDTEIDTFTKIHHAYRLAMKSFKESKKEQAIGKMFEGDVSWYMEVLEEVYNNPAKRLNPDAWRTVMNCMSFTEEVRFSSEYADFFNEHYFLTDEVWEVVEKNYPIAKNKTFQWPDLCNGNFSVSADEVDIENDTDLMAYVEGKISIFYSLLGNDYNKAYLLIRPLVERFTSDDLNRWYLIISLVLNLEDEINIAYERLLEIREECELAHYYYSGYLYKQGDYLAALKVLDQIPLEAMDMHMKALKLQVEVYTNEQGNGLFSLSKKQEKLLKKGHYKKVLLVD